MGEAFAAFELGRLFTAWNKDLRLVFSNGLSWEDISRSNVVFIGPSKHNLQIRDLPVQMDFVIEDGRIVNQRPHAGEPQLYMESWMADHSTLREGHALISRLPGLHRTGYIMMLGATSTEGTRAALEYVTRPDYASQLVLSLKSRYGALPKYFQIVVKAQYKAQLPIRVQQVAVHAIADK